MKKILFLLLGCLFFIVEPTQAGFLSGAYGKLMSDKMVVDNEAPEVVYHKEITGFVPKSEKTYLAILEIRGVRDYSGNIQKTYFTIEIKEQDSNGEYSTTEFQAFKKGRSYYTPREDANYDKNIIWICSFDGYSCYIHISFGFEVIYVCNTSISIDSNGNEQLQNEGLKSTIYLREEHILHDMIDRAISFGIFRLNRN